MDGMISKFSTAFSNSFLSFLTDGLPFKCSSKKSKYLFTVSSHDSLRDLSSCHLAYLL